jgi:hypothetical protein
LLRVPTNLSKERWILLLICMVLMALAVYRFHGHLKKPLKKNRSNSSTK